MEYKKQSFLPKGLLDIVRELDREKASVIISKDIKKSKKPTTVVRGLEETKDVQSIARVIKTKLGAGGT